MASHFTGNAYLAGRASLSFHC